MVYKKIWITSGRKPILKISLIRHCCLAYLDKKAPAYKGVGAVNTTAYLVYFPVFFGYGFKIRLFNIQVVKSHRKNGTL